MQSYYLYEHSTSVSLAGWSPESRALLKAHLQRMWDNRPRLPHFRDDEGGPRNTEQRYVRFHLDDNWAPAISARNYVGQITVGEHTLHLLPKVCQRPTPKSGAGSDAESGAGAAAVPDTAPTSAYLSAVHVNLLWWLSYSERLRFPRALTTFAAVPTSMLELQILLFAQYTHELLSRTHYQQYQEVSEDLNTLRGHVRFGQYATNYATGRAHYLPCTYDSFQADNLFNRILKDVTGRLLAITAYPESERLLQEIHFLLDEAAPHRTTLADCDRVRFSALFDDFQVVLDYCRLFLADSGPLSAHAEEVRVFAVLLPTEVIFEDFLTGFVRQHFGQRFNVRSQTQDLHLANLIGPDGRVQDKCFQLKHDLLLEPAAGNDHAPIILDAKYKLVWARADGTVAAESVSQADMYQMVSYAFRRGATHTHLCYPDSVLAPAPTTSPTPLTFTVLNHSGEQASLIQIQAHRLPVVIQALFAEAPALDALPDAVAHQEEQLSAALAHIL
jgi:5-methylcytosine-specific restriction enzyme subunit McrC